MRPAPKPTKSWPARNGDLAGADATRFTELTGQLDTLNTRLDELTAEAIRATGRADTMARAGAGRRVTRGPLPAEAEDTARAFRSAIYSKNPAPIEVYNTRAGDEWPSDMPAPATRCGQLRRHTGANPDPGSDHRRPDQDSSPPTFTAKSFRICSNPAGSCAPAPP